ncbi:M35 family metallopeptidase [Saccharothrix sp. BKS2]|uniref:M35 family metallopeptidase n=1 Tax=Saccharothrix sp. BKS2 TaxID=3064400 RepID=UPI0039EBE759
MAKKRSAAPVAVLTALLLTGATAATAAATPGPNAIGNSVTTDFPVSLTTAPEHRLGDPVVLDFELRNATDRDVSVLVWDTPLEGGTLRFVRVHRAGVEVPYDGRSIKRGDPSAASYAPVPAGGAVHASFDLTSAFAITEPGDYTATLDARLRDVVTGAPSTRARADLAGVALEPVAVGFRVLPGGPARITGGETARRSAATPAGRAEPNPPAFDGGTDTERRQITRAHEQGFRYTRDAFREVPEGEAPPRRYKKWFGAFGENRYQRVHDSYGAVLRYFTQETITYTPHGEGCRDDYYAYTYFDAKAVWLCPVFWRIEMTGLDSKAGTVVHELSHAAAHTEDHVYGTEAALRLAEEEPGKAVRNADNYEYFAETTS